VTRVPRASLTIDLIDDADFCGLMASRGGREAFGVFVALLVAGRRMLQQGRAGRHQDDSSLVFFDTPKHVLTRVSLSQRTLNHAVDVISGVCSANKSDPWIAFDTDGRIIVRSFFKYNTSEGWGGDRPGSGRPAKNHLDSEGPESTCAPPAPSPSPAPAPITAAATAGARGAAAAADLSLTPKTEDRDPIADALARHFPGRSSWLPAARRLAEARGVEKACRAIAEAARAREPVKSFRYVESIAEAQAVASNGRPSAAASVEPNGITPELIEQKRRITEQVRRMAAGIGRRA
jgi:hypothetical protein